MTELCTSKTNYMNAKQHVVEAQNTLTAFLPCMENARRDYERAMHELHELTRNPGGRNPDQKLSVVVGEPLPTTKRVQTPIEVLDSLPGLITEIADAGAVEGDVFGLMWSIPCNKCHNGVWAKDWFVKVLGFAKDAMNAAKDYNALMPKL